MQTILQFYILLLGVPVSCLYLCKTGHAYHTLQSPSLATLTVNVLLVSYNNPTSHECDSGSCFGDCDNEFQFCLRRSGTLSCLATITTDELAEDFISFSASDLSTLGISNPLTFSSISTSVRA